MVTTGTSGAGNDVSCKEYLHNDTYNAIDWRRFAPATGVQHHVKEEHTFEYEGRTVLALLKENRLLLNGRLYPHWVIPGFVDSAGVRGNVKNGLPVTRIEALVEDNAAQEFLARIARKIEDGPVSFW